MATSKDVAALAGVAHATVSRAFSSPEKVSAQTLARVMKAAEELCYIPNSLASSLKSVQSNTVGYILSNINNSFFTDIAHNLQKHLFVKEMNLLIGISDENTEEEIKCIVSQMSYRAEMILFTPSAYSSKCEMIINGAKDIRFIQLFRNCYEGVDSLVVNDRKGCLMAVNALLKKGRRRILLLDGESKLPTGRSEGYCDAFSSAGLPVDRRFLTSIPLCDDQTERIARLFDELQPDAVIAVSEFLLSQVIILLRRRQLTAGRDIGLIAYDDSYIARAMDITVIAHDEELIITRIQDMMNSAVINRSVKNHIVLDPILIKRGSE